MAIVDQIVAEAQSQGVDPALAIEVARRESGLDPNVPDSKAGAIGIFQLVPATAAQLGVNPRDVSENIHGGVTYLRLMLQQFGDVATALAGYNWGPGHLTTAIAQWGSNWFAHAPTETKNYVTAILNALTQYQKVLSPASVAAGVQSAVSQAAQQLSDLFSSVTSTPTSAPAATSAVAAGITPAKMFWIAIGIVGAIFLLEVRE